MKTRAARILFFSAGFLALVLVVNGLLGVWFRGSLPRLGEAEFEELTGELEFLVVGGSHGEDAVDPEVLGDTFNYCLRGENHVLSYYKLKEVLERDDGLKIESVILPFEIHSFSTFWRYQIRPLSFWSDYVDFIEMGFEYGEVRFPTVKLIESTLFPYAQDIDNSTHLLFPNSPSQVPVRGYIPRQGGLLWRDDWRVYAQGRVDMYLGGEDPLDPDQIAYFKKSLRLCREHGVQVYLVQYPVTEAFYEAADRVIGMEEFERRQLEILEEFPEVELISLRKALFDRPELFANHDHLNHEGAEIFTALLRERIDKSRSAED